MLLRCRGTQRAWRYAWPVATVPCQLAHEPLQTASTPPTKFGIATVDDARPARGRPLYRRVSAERAFETSVRLSASTGEVSVASFATRRVP